MKRARAIALAAFILAASASVLVTPTTASAQRELLSDRAESRSDLRDLISDRASSRDDLRDLLRDRMDRRGDLRDLISDRVRNRDDLSPLLNRFRDRLGGSS